MNNSTEDPRAGQSNGDRENCEHKTVWIDPDTRQWVCKSCGEPKSAPGRKPQYKDTQKGASTTSSASQDTSSPEQKATETPTNLPVALPPTPEAAYSHYTSRGVQVFPTLQKAEGNRLAKAPVGRATGVTGKSGEVRSIPPQTGENIAIRLPPGVVGMDVDAYGDKQGAETLARFEKEYGPLGLELTDRSSAREEPSGIYLFRCPEGWRGLDVGVSNGFTTRGGTRMLSRVFTPIPETCIDGIMRTGLIPTGERTLRTFRSSLKASSITRGISRKKPPRLFVTMPEKTF